MNSKQLETRLATLWAQRRAKSTEQKLNPWELKTQRTRLDKRRLRELGLRPHVSKIVHDLCFLLKRRGQTPNHLAMPGGPFPGNQVPTILTIGDLERWFAFKWQEMLRKVPEIRTVALPLQRQLNQQLWHFIRNYVVLLGPKKADKATRIVLDSIIITGRSLCDCHAPFLHSIQACPLHHAVPGDVVVSRRALWLVTARGLVDLGVHLRRGALRTFRKNIPRSIKPNKSDQTEPPLPWRYLRFLTPVTEVLGRSLSHLDMEILRLVPGRLVLDPKEATPKQRMDVLFGCVMDACLRAGQPGLSDHEYLRALRRLEPEQFLIILGAMQKTWQERPRVAFQPVPDMHKTLGPIVRYFLNHWVHC